MPAARATAPAPFGLAASGALLLGVLVVQGFPSLPPTPLVAILGVCGACLWWQPGARRLAGVALVGIALACLHGQASLGGQLPAAWSGQVFTIEGRVSGLPLHDIDASRFEFVVTGAEADAAFLLGKKLRLGWYVRPPDTVPDIPPGSRWRLTAKLRSPRGLVNPGGFDFERRALEHRISATGYVIQPRTASMVAAGSGLDSLRGRLAGRIAVAVPDERARFVAALALGDTRGLSSHDWEVLRATGLTHLIAISGFHVGLVAGFGALLGQGVYRLLPGLGRRWPRPQGVAAMALVFAAAYTALAGFELPTVRTMLMIAAVLLARLARRPQGLPESLAFALVAILLADPLSVLAPGFWLSFLGVAWLIWCLPQSREEGVLKPYLQAQGVAVLGLLPLTIWFFSQASPPGPLVNLIGIPWISLGVVPLSLIGLAAAPFSDELAAIAWRGAGTLMQWLWIGLEQVAAWPSSLLWLPEPGVLVIVLAMTGAFWLLLPRGVPGKSLAALLLVPMLWPAIDRPRHGEADLLLLDVGQGLALVVRTRQHTLLYDAGPAMPRGLDLGEAVVLPALRARGIHRLDLMMLSHGDNDHAGGAEAVARAMPPTRTLAPAGWAKAHMQPCVAGDGWEWDGVRFSVLHPTPHFPYLRNDSSCVLRIDAAGSSALLPGDIGRHVESRLARLPPAQISADVLLVPHHGSDTSSSLDFLAAVRPALGLVPVGHENRFNMPRPIVLRRYRRYGVELHDTAGSGAIDLRLGQRAELRQRLRQDRPRYWRHAGHDRSGYAIGSPEPDR